MTSTPRAVWESLAHEGRLKVPEVTIVFWVIKLLSTAMGESTSDFLVFHINPYVAVVAGCVGLAIALVLQVRADRYYAWVYWFAIVMVAVFGTMAADVVHVVLGVPYFVSSIAFSASLVIVFVVWHRVEGTLSIHTIRTRRRELFYWATVIATFALGTAAGDLTAATFRLGYPGSVALFAILFAVPAVGWRFLGWNAVVAFWTAYVITRPLGASVADWLGKPILGGLGYGDQYVALVLTALIAILVGRLAVTREDVAEESLPAALRRPG